MGYSAVVGVILLLLFSLLAKEHIAPAALLLALLSTFHITRIQQRRIEKLEDEYKGQRAINLAAAEKHKTAYLALQQNFNSASKTSTACTRAHYEHPSAEIVRENQQLKERLHQLRLARKTTTCTRAHCDRSIAEISCANHVLKGSTRKLRGTIDGLKSDVDRREKTVKSLQRSLEALHAARAEEVKDKDAVIEDLACSMQAVAARHSDRDREVYRLRAAAHHSDRYKAVYRSRAATQKAEAFAHESRNLRARGRASQGKTNGGVAQTASGGVDQERKKVHFLQEGAVQALERRPLSPKCATVEDDDEEEL
jgi:chromosome segregation ATPase